MNDSVRAKLVDELIGGEHWPVSDQIRPLGDDEVLAPFFEDRGDAMPKALDELDVAETRYHNLSISAAVELQIPVIGSGSGGFSRRVIVAERAAFRSIHTASTERQYGYAVRLCVTVNRWQADGKIGLPFLAASAQLGQLQAEWTLQVIGISGKSIDEAILPPSELNVETFVLARQSLEKIIAAVHAADTKFQPRLIAEIHSPDTKGNELRAAIATSYALSCLERGSTLENARQRLGIENLPMQAVLDNVYETFAGVTGPDQRPVEAVRRKAAEICGRLKTDIQWSRRW